MKKVLFATTALVATAGVAAADVTFGGYGRFGVIYVEDAPNETAVSVCKSMRQLSPTTASPSVHALVSSRTTTATATVLNLGLTQLLHPVPTVLIVLNRVSTVFVSSLVPAVWKSALATSTARSTPCLACTPSSWA